VRLVRARAGQFVDQCAQDVGAAREQRHVGAQQREFDRRRAADALAGAAHEGMLAGKVEVHAVTAGVGS